MKFLETMLERARAAKQSAKKNRANRRERPVTLEQPTTYQPEKRRLRDLFAARDI